MALIIFLFALHKAITELFKLNFWPLLLKKTLKQKTVVSFLKHGAVFFDQNLKRKIVRIKSYVENILIKWKNEHEIDK